MKDYLCVRYALSSEQKYNNEDLAQIQEMLQKFACFLEIEDGVLRVSVLSKHYQEHKTRKAGRKKKSVRVPGEKEVVYDSRGEKYEFDKNYKFSDVVYMLQSMKDKEIMSKLNMTESTYYRRKRAMKNSEFYKNIDQNRLGDKEYLESIEGNYSF